MYRGGATEGPPFSVGDRVRVVADPTFNGCVGIVMAIDHDGPRSVLITFTPPVLGRTGDGSVTRGLSCSWDNIVRLFGDENENEDWRTPSQADIQGFFQPRH